jgi:gluconolactonase
MKILALLCLALASSLPAQEQESVERLSPELDQIIAPDAKVETLCTGFTWAEGPVWDVKGQRLLFSDVPRNTIFQWREGDKEASVFMTPSGYTGVEQNYCVEPGSNGLAMDAQGRLFCCEHGDRRVSYLAFPGGKRTLVDAYDGKRLNSPNDLTISPNGFVYFTDPPYGLPGREKDTQNRELPINGVYAVSPTGKIQLVTDKLERPNGITLSVDHRTLYVGQSHGPAPHIMTYSLREDGWPEQKDGTLFFDCSKLDGPGAPDGMKMDRSGILFATGPGGVLILTPQAKLLGRILCHRSTANVAIAETPTGKWLYMTSKDRLLRISLRTSK